jgi:hypothetical protein
MCSSLLDVSDVVIVDEVAEPDAVPYIYCRSTSP